MRPGSRWPPSNATATSTSSAPPKASTGPGRQHPRPGRLEGVHPPTSPVSPHSSPSTPTTTVAHREGLPDVQTRPTGQTDLPPHPRLDRRASDGRVRRPSGQPLGRAPNRLEHQNSSDQPAATAPSPSEPDATPSSPPNPHPTTSPKHSSPSTATVLALAEKGRSLFVPGTVDVAVEHECQSSVSPLSPEHTRLSTLLKGGGL